MSELASSPGTDHLAEGCRVEAAQAAALTVARAHGVAADEAALLHDGVNVVVHLQPAPVVARVATLTPLLRPAVHRPFSREIALAGALAAAGAAVVPSSDLLPPGPHQHDGLTLSFWRFVEVLPDTPTPAQAGAALGELRAALAEVDPGWDGGPLDTRLDGRAAVDALPDPMTDAELAPFSWLRRLHIGAWWFVHASRGPADLATAHDRLASAVEHVSAGLRGRRQGPA